MVGLKPKAVLMHRGEAALYAGGTLLKRFHRETSSVRYDQFFTAIAHRDVELMIVPKQAIEDIPIEWKTREPFEIKLTANVPLF